MNNGYFPFPNIVVDKLLYLLTGAEYKVLSLVIRQTIGWRKQWDRISISQFRKKCNLSRPGVIESVKVLVENELILCEKFNDSGKLPENWYALFGATNESARLVRSVDQYDKLTSQVILQEMVKSVDHLGDKLVRSPDTQKKAFKEIEKTPPTPKTDVTKQVSSETEEVVAGDSDSKEELRMSQKAKKIQELIAMKWGKQITTKPDIGACKDLLRAFRWDHSILVCAITEGPEILDYPNSVMKMVGRIAERIERDNAGIKIEPLTAAEDLVKHLRYCAKFPNRASEVYPTLEALAEEVGRPLDELYAENDFLLLKLPEYKRQYEGEVKK